MERTNQPDPGPRLDPFSLIGATDDDAWMVTVRAVASPTGLKVWSLKIEPTDRVAGDPLPNDAPGAGINTGVLKKISFPQIRKELARRTGGHVARVLDELDRASPEDREIIVRELVRAQSEESRSGDPTNRPGRPAAGDMQRAQWALEVLRNKDEQGYRKRLRELWSRREENPTLKLKTVDTRMRRLAEDGWLIGYGRKATAGPKLGNPSDAQQPSEQE